MPVAGMLAGRGGVIGPAGEGAALGRRGDHWRRAVRRRHSGAMAGQVRVLLEPVSPVCMVTRARPVPRHTAADYGAGRCAQASVTARPGRLIVPGGQYHVMISTASRPARTAGSASASCRDCSSEPVR